MFRGLFSALVATLSLSIVVSSPSIAQSEPNSVEDIRASTREDILAAIQFLEIRHPGMYNPFDQDFPAKLERARTEALAAASLVENEEDRFLAIRIINRALADGHARVQFGYNGRGHQWPGFHGAWRGDGLYVTTESDTGPPRGSMLLSCDGQAAEDLIRGEAFQFFGRPDEAGQWWQLAGSFFRRSALSVAPEPENCRFRAPDGTEQTVEMNWEPTPDDYWRQIPRHEPAPLGLADRGNGIQWVTLSTFGPDPDGVAAYERLFQDLYTQASELTESRAIVLDLRGNNGGSSTWSRRVAEHLWGEEAVDWALADYFRDTDQWYLADQGNIAYFESVAPELRERGLLEIAEWAEETHKSLQAAYNSGERFYKIPFGAELLAEAEPTEPRELPPVYVITDGGCVSACLDAVDTFTRFDNVKLVGAPTSADTVYLEVHTEPLPIGRGFVLLPTKIWVNRPRGSGEVYHPDILVTDLDWNSETILQHIERDLDGY